MLKNLKKRNNFKILNLKQLLSEILLYHTLGSVLIVYIYFVVGYYGRLYFWKWTLSLLLNVLRLLLFPSALFVFLG